MEDILDVFSSLGFVNKFSGVDGFVNVDVPSLLMRWKTLFLFILWLFLFFHSKIVSELGCAIDICEFSVYL